MEIKMSLEALKNGDESILGEIYLHFRSAFISWMNSAHKSDIEKTIETYKYALLSLYEAVIENDNQFHKENDVKVYLFSVAKNYLLSDSNRRKLSYQADLEDEDFGDQADKRKRLNLLIKKVSEQGYPCKDLLKLYYFNNLPNNKIADKLEYKLLDSVDDLKDKCIKRIKKLLLVTDDEF